MKALHTPAAHDLSLPEFAATYPEHGEVRARTRHRRASEASLAQGPRTGEGPSGLGERFYGAGAVDAHVHETLAPLMRGQDPRRTEHLAARAEGYLGWHSTGAETRGNSTFDIRTYNTCAGTDDIKDDTDQSAEELCYRLNLQIQ